MRTFAVSSILLLLLSVGFASAQHSHGSGAAAHARVPLYAGLSTLHHKVTTKSTLAQRYFDQGLRLAYAFNHDEAERAFLEAARLDSTCAMAWWGAALVLGPNINMPMSPEAERDAYAHVQRALALRPGAGEIERLYIEALAKRYDPVPGSNRATRDSAYADAMRGVMARDPADPDAAVLCAEALMDLRPWDLWTLDGKPQPGTPEITSILEGILKKSPDHIGAIHLYIHAVEASPEPGRAERYADRLGKLAPYAGHLVHMPSHIHLRVGRYEDAVEVNARAIAADRDYIRKQGVSGMYTVMYYPHNIHMRWYALCELGRRADALDAARDLAAAVPDSLIRALPMAEFFRPSHDLTQVRFGLWDEILKESPPAPGMPLSNAVHHYARGMAFAATGHNTEASIERDSLNAIAAAAPPDLIYGLNGAQPVFRFAATHLAGEIAARDGKTDEAIRILGEAVHQQDSLRYDEPPPWNISARQSLGAVLLASGKAPEAEAVYREDLARNPENGWSLYGLVQALRSEKKESEAAAVEKRYRLAWATSDVTLQASRY
jgi:tetratricopeptide (TPR) repeat protein